MLHHIHTDIKTIDSLTECHRPLPAYVNVSYISNYKNDKWQTIYWIDNTMRNPSQQFSTLYSYTHCSAQYQIRSAQSDFFFFYTVTISPIGGFYRILVIIITVALLWPIIRNTRKLLLIENSDWNGPLNCCLAKDFWGHIAADWNK